MAEQQNENQKKKKAFISFLDCNDNNFFGCFIKKCLDTSITGKLVGMLVVSLLGFILVTVQHNLALGKIETLSKEIKEQNIPQYKISQYILRNLNGFKISLLHLLNQPQVREDDKNILANLQRLDELERMVLALKQGGSLLDVAKASQKTLDIITIVPSEDPEINTLADNVIGEFNSLAENFHLLTRSLVEKTGPAAQEDSLDNVLDNLDALQHEVTNLAIRINENYGMNLAETDATIKRSQRRAILTSGFIVLILIAATILYIFLIVFPLKDILKKIKRIAKGEGDLSSRIEIRTHDEVGRLAKQLNNLVDNIYSLNAFKAVIEEEESTTEVNKRLAQLLQERYHHNNLFIYETIGNKNNMAVAFASAYEDICSPDILDDSNFCRAKRTGHPISSIQFPEICKKFPHGDRLEHHCVPMIANGRAVAIVQFLHPKSSSPQENERFETEVKRAMRYIKEATPVIEAKRFASALQESTLKDPMTDLYNRRFLESYTDTLVASTLRRQSKVGILMCDMDFFKEVNDTHGHEIGDMVLIKTAEILQACVRAADMIIRYGGEEFLVLLNDVKGPNDIADLAERIRVRMENTSIKLPDGVLKKTLSIGYSLFPDDTDGFWEAIKFADVALYRAKETGRNKVVAFKPEMWTQEKY